MGTSNVAAIPVIRKYNVSMDYPHNVSMNNPWIHCISELLGWLPHWMSDARYVQMIHGLSMDHPTSNVVATPVIQKYNVSMDYPWIIHGSSNIQCGSHPVLRKYNVSMDYPWIIRTSSVVAIPVIRKYNVSMDYPWIIHGSSDIQCGSHPSTSEIQCIHGLSMDYPWIIRHPMW